MERDMASPDEGIKAQVALGLFEKVYNATFNSRNWDRESLIELYQQCLQAVSNPYVAPRPIEKKSQGG